MVNQVKDLRIITGRSVTRAEEKRQEGGPVCKATHSHSDGEWILQGYLDIATPTGLMFSAGNPLLCIYPCLNGVAP